MCDAPVMLIREDVSNLAALYAVRHRDLLVMLRTERLRDFWVVCDVMRVLAKPLAPRGSEHCDIIPRMLAACGPRHL